MDLDWLLSAQARVVWAKGQEASGVVRVSTKGFIESVLQQAAKVQASEEQQQMMQVSPAAQARHMIDLRPI